MFNPVPRSQRQNKKPTVARKQIKEVQNRENIKNTLLMKIDGIWDDYKTQPPWIPSQIELEKEEAKWFPPMKPIPQVQLPQLNKQLSGPAGQKPKSRALNKRRKKCASFMTDVGLIKLRKQNKNSDEKPENSQFINNVNQQIDNLLKNIDEIDDGTSNPKNTKFNPNGYGNDVRELINDIDDYKAHIQEEFDEVKYLIQFADKTHKWIDRHKNVMTNIFNNAGIRKNGVYNDGDDDDTNLSSVKKQSVNQTKKKGNITKEELWNGDDEDDQPKIKDGYYYRRAKEDTEDLGEVFNKLKKINKIKDNLSNIQDDFLGYHQNLHLKIKEKKKKD